MAQVHLGPFARLLAAFGTLALALALVAAVPMSAAGDTSTDRVDLMRAAVASGEARTGSFSYQDNHETPARQCWADDENDTFELDEDGDDHEPAEEPRADIVEFCANFGPTLSLTVTTAQLTDPERDDNWNGATFIGWFVDVDDDGEGDYFVDYSLDRDGVLATRVQRIEDSVDTCSGDSISADATETRYSVSGIGAHCFDGETDFQISVAVFYDTVPEEGAEAGGVFFDSAPGGAEFQEVTEGGAARASDRLWGIERIRTSIAISNHQFPDSDDAPTVYLARAGEPPGADASPDAVAGGVLTDGPIILVPSTGEAPDVVKAEVNRLAPERVIALGGPNAIADSVVASAAGNRPTSRLAGPTRIETAVAISQHQFANADSAVEVYLARSGPTLADAVVGGVLTGGPILLVPTEGPIPAAVRAEIDRLDPGVVFALGGEAAIRNAVLQEAAAHRDTDRLAGQGRLQTAVAISQHAFPDPADELYIARADVFADALAGGILTGGPILLVPNDVQPDDDRTAEQIWNSTYADVANEISRVAPLTVYALGGTAAITDRVLALAANS